MEIHTLTAVQLRNALRSGELSSVEIVQALHARTDAIDASLNAYVEEFREQALLQAKDADRARANGDDLGPLHGLPLSVKENLATKGSPQTIGIRSRLQDLATGNAVIVDSALEAGAIVLGKTNIPLLLLAMESHNDIYGTTVNPWNSTRVPGGSSGGEAAAIATGQSLFGFGTDIGGSIRIPCAWCGLPGLKPSGGFWSMKGSAGAMPGQEVIRAQAGPMARTVADLELLMEALAPIRQRQFDARMPPIDFQTERIDLAGLRVGFCLDDGVFTPSTSVQRVLHTTVRLLEEAGAEVIPYQPPDNWSLVETYFGSVSADGAATIKAAMGRQSLTPQLKLLATMAAIPNWLRPVVSGGLGIKGQARAKRLFNAFGDKSVRDYWRLTAQRTIQQQREMDAWDQAGFDFLLVPPTVTPAALLGETGDWSLGAWQTMRFNLLDLPAGVVPAGRVQSEEAVARQTLVDDLDHKAARFEMNSTGLPLAVQIVGRPWSDASLLALMRELEQRLKDQADYPHTPIDPVVD